MILEQRPYSLVLFIALISIILVTFYQAVYAQQLTDLFAPFAYLIWGPNLNQNLPLQMTFTIVYNGATNQNLSIYNPSIQIINNLNESRAYIFDNSNTTVNRDIQISFDPYYIFNRQSNLYHYIPKTSNIVIAFSKVLNEDFEGYITQAQLGSPINLPYSSHDNGQHLHFAIPGHLETGLYLVNAFIYFPDYKVGSVYSNTIYLDSTNSTHITNSTISRTNSY